MDDEPLFAGKDLELIEALVYDPDSPRGFELLTGALVWGDEMPQDFLTRPAMVNMKWLLAARTYLQLGEKLWDVPDIGKHLELIWARAKKQKLSWPGFNRMVLTEDDKAYLDKCLHEEDF